MSRRYIFGKLLPVFSLSLFFVIGCFAAPFITPAPAPQPNPQGDCSKTTDADIVRAVIENIKKKFTPEQVASQLHFTVTCKDGVVSISGDAHGINRKDPREVRTRVTRIAQKTACVKKVNTKHFTHEHPIKCAKTQKECNGGCIGQNEECTPLR